jgi:hypothetical protein
MKSSRSVYVKAAAAALALAAAGTASVAQARSDVYYSIGANVAPGVSIGVSNAPVYYPPVYYQPAPVYYQPAPVYVRPAPVFVPAPTYYVRPAPIYYVRPAPVYGASYYYGPGGHWKHNKHRKHRADHGYRY